MYLQRLQSLSLTVTKQTLESKNTFTERYLLDLSHRGFKVDLSPITYFISSMDSSNEEVMYSQCTVYEHVCDLLLILLLLYHVTILEWENWCDVQSAELIMWLSEDVCPCHVNKKVNRTLQYRAQWIFVPLVKIHFKQWASLREHSLLSDGSQEAFWKGVTGDKCPGNKTTEWTHCSRNWTSCL